MQCCYNTLLVLQTRSVKERQADRRADNRVQLVDRQTACAWLEDALS